MMLVEMLLAHAGALARRWCGSGPDLPTKTTA